MREVQYLDAMREVTERMTYGGVFLSAGGERPNVMTVGWGWMGFCWGKPVFTAVVRPQRHTYAILCETGEFTISVPAAGKMRAELPFAGPRAAREMGVIHTIQGSDRSYAYVVMGNDIVFDERSGRIAVDPSSYFDANGKRGATGEELEAYIKNIYYVLMTRGVRGTHLYVCDPALRRHLARFFTITAR